MADTVLKTKLLVPQLKTTLVHRPALIIELDQGLAGKLATVCAPAGYGKTTLACQWAAQTRWPVCWYSLDSSDNDPRRFLRYFLAAVHSLGNPIGKNLVALANSTEPFELSEAFALLINELCEIDYESVLVLDDYHEIRDARIHRSLSFLLASMPPRFHLLLLSRRAPKELGLAKLRALGQLREIGQERLRFSLQDTADFFAQAQIALEPTEQAFLQQRTEGWPLSLQLALVSLRHAPDQAVSLRAFSGSHRYIADYLLDEVLHQLEPVLQAFLLQTSVVPRFNASLCQALTGQERCDERLQELEEQNLFLIPLDPERNWFRYHHLFGELLQKRLRQQQPDTVPSLYTQAGRWFQEQGDCESAIDCFLKAGETRLAEKLMEKVVPELLKKRAWPAVVQWMAQLPGENLLENLSLSVDYAAALTYDGQSQAAQAWLARVLARCQAAPDGVGTAWARARLVQALMAYEGENYAAIEAHTREALAVMPSPAADICGPAYYNLGMVHCVQDQFDEALEAFSRASPYLHEANDVFQALQTHHNASFALIDMGHLDAAEETLNRAVQEINRHQVGCYGISGWIYGSLAKIQLLRNELDLARQYLTKATNAAHWPKYAFVIQRLWVYYHLSVQDFGQAAQSLKSIQALVAANPSIAYLAPQLAALEARLAVSRGKAEAAAAWAEQASRIQWGGLRVRQYEAAVTYAYFLLLREQKQQALDVLSTVQPRLEQAGAGLPLIRTLCFLAWLRHHSGQGDQAEADLTRALELAAPQRISRPFLDCLFDLQPLLGAVAHAGPPAPVADFARHILCLAVAENRAYLFKFGSEGPAGLEELSQRENEILTLISRGLTNRAICQQLFVSENTLKTHIRNIYRKLGVETREAAIVKFKG